jgi:2-dehydro-3-deoxyphosphogluconate aldolase/(4S)-4-hydroxy-2-oxoglutarate aldolase
MARNPAFAPLLKGQPVIPVIAIVRLEDAVPMAHALAAGGMKVIELTLRTPVALAACREIVRDCPEIVLGIGTILTPDQVTQAVDIGAKFLVTPGTTEKLARKMADCGAACLPGSATISEMVQLMEWGFSEMKFFPAGPAGGLEYLKAVAGPIPELRFCPTGGVSPQNAPDYLAQPNILCVGGSWVTPKALMAARDWAGITKLAAEASAIRPRGA